MLRPPSTASWAGHPQGTPAYRRVLISLFCAGVATFSQLYSTQAVLPQISHDLRVSAATSSLTVSAATLGLAISVLAWSAIADRFGRVPAMVCSISAATLLGIISAFSPSITALILMRFFEGFALGGVPAIAIAYLSEEVDHRHLPSAAAIFVAGNSIGGLSGRLIAGPVAEFTDSWRTGVFFTLIWCLAAAIAFSILIPRSRGFVPLCRRAPENLPKKSTLQRIMLVASQPRLIGLYLQGFLLMGSFVAIYNYLGFRLIAAPFGLPTSLVSLLFIMYLGGTVTSAIAGHFAEQRGRFAVLMAGIVAMVGGLALTIPNILWCVIVGLLVFTMGFFAAHAIASGWVGQIATVGKAQASSLYTLLYYIGSSVIGWLVGYAFHAMQWNGVVLAITSALLVSAFLAVVLVGEHPSESRQRTAQDL